MNNENNIELKQGVMSNKELALWFGIKPNSFAHSKLKKLEELKKYADYEILPNKKIKINKVHIPYYSKSYTQILNNMDNYWSEDGLDSCKHVSYILEEQLDLPITRETIEKYACRGRNELWGRPFSKGGKNGGCIYVWCKRFGEGINTRYQLLTKEEEQIKQSLIKKYFGDATQKQIIVKGMVESKEITKQEAWDVLTQLTNMQGSNFLTFLTQLEEKLQCTVVRGTLVERNIFALEEKKNAS